MNPLIVSQCALDDALVVPDDHAEIGKCNIRIVPIKTQKEATYQVVLDTLTLSPYYNVFLITTDVPEIYMHQFKQTCVVFKDTPTVSKKKPLDQSQRLKGVQVMSIKERLDADTKKAIKASKLAIGQQNTASSSEGAGLIPEVLDE
ncbi:hypothetical protein Tco_1439684 [Tanacetum coccineum]